MAKIGLIQVLQRPEDDYAARTEFLYRAAEDCFRQGADIVFFPEAYQYVPDRTVLYRPQELKNLADAWKARCSELARKYRAYLAPWDYAVENGKIYNSTYILDRNGEEIGRFRKVHLTHAEQMRGLSGGDDFPVFDTDIGKIGVMICWDNYFPESARCLGNRGAQLVLYPLYGDTLEPAWEIKLRARSADNAMTIAACQIDNHYTGACTCLVGPDGNFIAKVEKAPSWQVAEADISSPVITHTNGNPENTEDFRRYIDRCRRPDAYAGILEEPNHDDWNDIFYGNPPKVLTKAEYEEQNHES